ncbi:hypothetical protein [Brevundimonas vesicularis]|uniref:hypothetical protein n=1 Tax=Brevundimonas vesicularis TaxID=41276 RepID=UPI0038D4F6B3
MIGRSQRVQLGDAVGDELRRDLASVGVGQGAIAEMLEVQQLGIGASDVAPPPAPGEQGPVADAAIR